MTAFSILDTVPVSEGSTPRAAMQASAALARLSEELGFARFWIAEHHAMDGIGGAGIAGGPAPHWPACCPITIPS